MVTFAAYSVDPVNVSRKTVCMAGGGRRLASVCIKIILKYLPFAIVPAFVNRIVHNLNDVLHVYCHRWRPVIPMVRINSSFRTHMDISISCIWGVEKGENSFNYLIPDNCQFTAFKSLSIHPRMEDEWENCDAIRRRAEEI